MKALRKFRLSAVTKIVLLPPISLVTAPAMAQLFADADASAANYTQAEIRPQMSCASLTSLELNDVIAISSQTIAASEQVPSHCRVDGTINPEITFQVNLPTNWNGRYYMVGNGGPAGQYPDTQAGARGARACQQRRMQYLPTSAWRRASCSTRISCGSSCSREWRIAQVAPAPTSTTR